MSARPSRAGAAQRPWVRRERAHSNSVWHVGWKRLDDGRWLVAYEDDASRLIVGHGVYAEPEQAGAVRVLRRAIKKYGRPAGILSARGERFCAPEEAAGRGEASRFEQALAEMGIRHMISGAGQPLTGAKLRRFYGEVQGKLPHFDGDIDGLVRWWNTVKPHASLNWDELETPEQAYRRKKAPADPDPEGGGA